MNANDAIHELTVFSHALELGCPKMAFRVEAVSPHGMPFRECFRLEVPGPGASKQSGVYFITDLDGEILYIGKATKNNLGNEICGKFRTATTVSENDQPFFGNSTLAEGASPQELQEMIRAGNVEIRAATITPSEFSSLAEVYLHVLCQRNNGWPALNKRIG